MLTDSFRSNRRLFRKSVQQGRSKRRGEAYSLQYVEPLSATRTPLADFINSLLQPIIEQQERRPIGGMIVLRMFEKPDLCALQSHRRGSHGIVMQLLIELGDQGGRSLVIKEPQRS